MKLSDICFYTLGEVKWSSAWHQSADIFLEDGRLLIANLFHYERFLVDNGVFAKIGTHSYQHQYSYELVLFEGDNELNTWQFKRNKDLDLHDAMAFLGYLEKHKDET